MRNATWMRRRRAAGKTRHRQIEASPKKMNRTAFPAKTRAEIFKYPIGLDERAPEAACVFGVVGSMLLVAIQRNRILDLVRHGVDTNRQLKLGQSTHDGPVKIRNRTRPQFGGAMPAIIAIDPELVINKIKSNFKCGNAVRDWRR